MPNNAIFIAVGDVKAGELVNELNDQLGDWQAGSAPVSDFDAPPERTARSLTIVDRPGSAQSNIVLTNLGVKRTHPDYFPLLVMMLGKSGALQLLLIEAMS